MLRLLRAITVVVLVMTCSGLTELIMSSLGADDDGCTECGCDCPGGCTSHDCPPGPMCPGTPHAALAEPPRLVSLIAATPVPSCFDAETQLPPSIFGESVFHPPRLVA